MNMSRQKHPSSKKDNPKSVTSSDACTEFARAATDFESDARLATENVRVKFAQPRLPMILRSIYWWRLYYIFGNIVTMNPNPSSVEKPDGDVNSEMIPWFTLTGAGSWSQS
jgi:hypothetical protein